MKLKTYGNKTGEYTIDVSNLNKNSIVYSAGIGLSVKFEIDLIKDFGLNIYAFDPSSFITGWLNLRELSNKFHFYPVGLAGYNGNAMFKKIINRKEDAYFLSSTILPRKYDGIKLPIKKLSTVIKELDHNKIDILKLDIEGAEYEVIEDIIKSNLIIDQITLEFHHHFSYVKIERTIEACKNLHNSNYNLVYKKQNMNECLFMHRRIL